ncbi:hypothetical protein C0Q70_00253 [Pomacea canaliculata]|uniref:Kinesin-like protein n=1 Tax=Pomacea canaliculata TaxID=400727 RepID=A0A2T7PW43_POMCA|nr:hypothetical protein C0Q70_00253 [Pomacea canaliculata]
MYEDVYGATTKLLIPNVISGYNATVFAYGATGAGKTYTMLGTDEEPGIMIYNEMIRDLLNPSLGYLELREDAKGNVQVAGISEVTARSTDEVMQMLVKGNRERTQEPTAANAASSRSHAILQVTVNQRNRLRSTMQEVRTGKLFLIDLAGSERAANTHNRGKRMVEGAHINRSLLALGNCINALSDKNGPRYINYRDSKLTRLLKDALGGNCKTVMIAHISPASNQFEESRNTLVYADRAKHIKTKVRRNVTDVAYHIAQYTNIISELREEIARLHSKIQDQGRPHVASILAVQSEVLGSQQNRDREELNHYKEQLLTSFKDQMELRRTLMELTNASMEVSLETSRNQLIISEWEANKARRWGEYPQLQDNRFLEDEKALELEGGDDFSDPEEIQTARDELKVLHDEKHKTQRIIATVQKELEVAQSKTRKLAEMIPMRVNGADQQEIMFLLCRVHQLEIENLESQSLSLYRDFQIKKKDMVLSRQRHYRNLSDEIIKRQKGLLDDQDVLHPKDLEEMYKLYSQERDERMQNGEDSGTITPLPKPLPLVGLNFYPAAEENREDGAKVFMQSAKTKHLRRSQVLSRLWRNEQAGDDGDDDQPYTHQLSLPAAPSRLSKTSFEDREIIASNTRNIAALAARRRTQANASNQVIYLGGRPLYRPVPDAVEDFPMVLTPSRLAQHNRLTEDGAYLNFSDDNLSQNTVEKTSVHTDNSLPPLLGSEPQYTYKKGDSAEKKNTGSYIHEFSKTRAKKNAGKKLIRYRPQNTSHLQPGDNNSNRALSSGGQLAAPVRGQKGNGRTRTRIQLQKLISLFTASSVLAADSSTVSTPHNGGKAPARKTLPSIPHYRKGDITVTGQGLPK